MWHVDAARSGPGLARTFTLRHHRYTSMPTGNAGVRDLAATGRAQVLFPQTWRTFFSGGLLTPNLVFTSCYLRSESIKALHSGNMPLFYQGLNSRSLSPYDIVSRSCSLRPLITAMQTRNEVLPNILPTELTKYLS